MMKNDVYEIAVKLLGLYCLLMFLFYIPAAVIAIPTYARDFVTNRTLYVAVLCFMPILYLFVGIFLVFKGSSVATFLIGRTTPIEAGKHAQGVMVSRLSFWITILGLYYFVSSVASLSEWLGSFSITTSQGAYWWSRIVAEGITLLLSVAFIFRSQQIESIINRGIRKEI